MILASGLLLRTYRIARDINKTKFIIDSAQPYKKNRKISIKISDKCAVPFSIRLIQTSYIILPVSILHSSINTKLAIAHEGQHHRQGDCLWEYVMEFTRIIFWFNPFINYWHQYFQELQELACDETLVSKKMVSAHDYGSCLFNVSQAASKYLHVHHQNLACTSQMISGREIETSLITRRICMLSKYKNDHLTKTMLGYIFTISALSVMGPLGAAYAAKGLLSQGAKLHSIDTSSIDPKMQIIAAKEISRVVRNSHAKSGAIVIADAHSGKIVAFAESGKSTGNDSWKSRVFNPASTIKPFIAAAAIDAGVVSEATIYDCHSLYQVGGKEITNGDAKAGNLSVADAMVSSNNICMVKVAQNTGSAKTRQTLTRFGFDMNTAWDNNNSDALNLANAALGFSIPVTLGTLTDAFTILANKGHFITANSGSAVSESTAKSVTHLLEKAVTEGTGKHAAIANVLVAGKTGTLSIPAHTSRLALFAGYVPSNSPRYVSIIVIENPIMDGSSANANGGNVAAPVFRNVFEKSLAMSK
jgi:beta-lactamase class D